MATGRNAAGYKDPGYVQAVPQAGRIPPAGEGGDFSYHFGRARFPFLGFLKHPVWNTRG
jgi:hypothetical protein